MQIVALVYEGLPIIMYRTDEVDEEQLGGYRMREAIKRSVPVEMIDVCFETTEDFLSLRGGVA